MALLLGNSSYKIHIPLPAVDRDIRDLALILKQMGYKVIAAVNMVKSEMEKLVKYFCEMVKNGMYGKSGSLPLQL